ncbi:MAG: DNRLRE domain-containing protein [Ruminococcaceae bacterium]|nr:DNRLRE domain-containing protein [Oscillospiraceae bacterium]
MYSKFVKLCSIILTLALLINLLPMQVLGEELKALLEQTENVSSNVVYDNELDTPSNATIIGESVDKRTEFSKEFKLSNGMSMIVVYPEAVHFEKDNAWEEIDNTLVTDSSRGIGTYRNKNNSWNVSLPQQLSATNKVTVEKDGYVVSFGMAGEKRRYIGQVETELLASASDNVLAVTEAVRTSSAQVVDLNYVDAKSMSAHPETVADTLQSRVQYMNVYQNTDIQYDLNSYQLKESIIIRSYNSAVRGYDFLLETGGLTPVLLKDNSIELQTAQGEVIMTLPAPYMIDKDGAISKDVGVTLTPTAGGYLLNYQMPMEWLADTDRAWPVVLDPVIEFELYRQNIKDQFVAQYYYEDYNHGAMYCGYNASYGKMRSFLRYVNIPELTSADVIVHAELSLYRLGGSVSLLPIEAHKVTGYWDSQTITWDNQPAYDPIIEDYCQVGGTNRYSWEITDIVKGWYNGENSESNTGVMLKAPDSVENGTTNFWKKFYTVDYDIYETSICPQMYIYFKNNNGIEGYWDYTSTSAGRAGAGYVNNYSGNLTWIRNDIGFGGNRMPVTISHVYNTNDSANNAFGLGYGWRTNYNQTVGVWSQDNSYYFWEDGDGTKHYFLWSAADNAYKDEDGLELILTVSGSEVTIEDKNGNKSFFDAQGRLYKMENNQATKSNITITYLDSTSKLIATITDGVGRKYNFYYSGGLLSKIGYTGKGTTELSYVTFGYTGSNLTSITDKDNESSIFTYGANNLLATVQDVDGYKLQYTYFTGLPKRVVGIHEYDGTVAGGYMIVEYAHNQTTFRDHNNNVQILQFNDWGNLIATQDDQGRAQYAQYARNEYKDEDTSKANQMSLSSKMQNTVSNLLVNNSFEHTAVWTPAVSSISVSKSNEAAYIGEHSLKVTSTETGTYRGAYSQEFTIEPGRTVTFSAYVKSVDAAAELAIIRRSDWSAFCSEVIPAGKDWARYQISYTNNSTVTDSIQCFIYVHDLGAVYMDCVQAEWASTASRYNLLDNGNFRFGDYAWVRCDDMTTTDQYTGATPPIPQLDTCVYSITGSPTVEKYLSQTLYINGSANDNYVLSGWAKADSVPLDTEGRKFGLEMLFYIDDDLQETHSVSFNADCDSTVEWQYAAAPVVPKTNYNKIVVRICYCNNANTALFDGIQLFKETFGTSYTYDDDGNVTNVVDLQNETTTYEYKNNNLTKIIQGNKAKMEYEYDNYHNVTKAITQKEDASGNIVDGTVYEFAYDTYGNNTLVKVVNGNMYISSSATYTPDGNRLHTTKDGLENTTTYCYNENTGVLEWVQYPNDTETSRTTYTYDEMYRIKTALATVPGLSEGTALTASYTYEDDLLTKIQTGSTTYSFTYGDFAQRTSVSVGDRLLAAYEYTEDANRYLDKLTYGNGDYIEYDYDDQSRLTLETFEDNHTVSYEYDNSGALSTMMDSATGRKTTYYYDLIGRLGKYKEVGSNYEHSVSYTYDERNNLSKLVETINGVEHVTDYAYDGENRIKTVTINGITRTYTYDAYGRITRMEDKQGETNLQTIVYTYHDTAERASTQIATMRTTRGTAVDVVYSYTYDGNGNILTISDGTNTTSYVYDSANQLIRENNQEAGKTWTWVYDNAGNITSHKEYAYTTGDLGTPIDTIPYTYGDDSWGDLLTAYDGTVITYDEIGNPLNDGTWTYSWYTGRELTSMTDGASTWNYVYDGNNMRISRSNGTQTYSYVYNGSQLTQMTVGSNTLNFAYDASGIPMMVTYNGTNYYYIVNLQGDVMGIVDSTGTIVVNYTYDAWGKPLSITGAMADTLGVENPLRYRSYVYDQETGLYYLQSRYYDPEIGRFINADNYPTTGQGLTGNNMFAYCGNNPVSRKDDGGDFWNVIVGAVVGAALSVASELVSQTVKYIATGEKIDWGDVITSAAGGAVYGGVMAATGSNMAASMASSATTSVISGVRNGDSVEKIIADTAKNTLISGAVCAAPKIINKSLGGKYTKLNAVSKFIKDKTSGPYQGKYDKGPYYLADSISYSTKRAGTNILRKSGLLVAEYAGKFIF